MIVYCISNNPEIGTDIEKSLNNYDEEYEVLTFTINTFTTNFIKLIQEKKKTIQHVIYIDIELNSKQQQVLHQVYQLAIPLELNMYWLYGNLSLPFVAMKYLFSYEEKKFIKDITQLDTLKSSKNSFFISFSSTAMCTINQFLNEILLENLTWYELCSKYGFIVSSEKKISAQSYALQNLFPSIIDQGVKDGPAAGSFFFRRGSFEEKKKGK